MEIYDVSTSVNYLLHLNTIWIELSVYDCDYPQRSTHCVSCMRIDIKSEISGKKIVN